MGCFSYGLCPTEVCSAFVFPVGRALARERTAQCATSFSAPLSHTAGMPDKYGADSQLCTVDTNKKIDG